VKQQKSRFRQQYATGEYSGRSFSAEIDTCISALIILYHHSLSAGQGEYSQNLDHELRQFGSAGLHSLVPKLDAYSHHIQSILPYNIDQASPLIANCLYRMAVWLTDLPDDRSRPDYPATLNLIKNTLSKLALRWKVAGKKHSARKGH
jgi:hypothetical protein